VGLKFPDGNGDVQRIDLDFGKPGEFSGVTQFHSTYSSAAALTQDGYESGSVSSLNFNNNGTLVFTFTNGVQMNAGQIATGVFLLPNYLTTIAQDCYRDNTVSGTAQIGPVQSVIHSKFLENRVAFVERRAVPFVVNQCVIQEDLKGVSFGDPRGLKAMEWKTVYVQDPFFCRAGEWISAKRELTWVGGDYRPLAGSICIDRGALRDDLPTRDIAGGVRPFEFNESPLIRFPGAVMPSMDRCYHDLGAWEVSRQQPESVVRVLPNTVVDNNLSGSTPLGRTILVTIQIKKEVDRPGVRSAKEAMLFAQPNMLNKCPVAAKRTFMLPGRPGWVCVTGMFDCEAFSEMFRHSGLMILSQTVDEQKTVDFWIVLDDGAYLKATGQVRYIRPVLDVPLLDLKAGIGLQAAY
jgi:hypothetical protein